MARALPSRVPWGGCACLLGVCASVWEGCSWGTVALGITAVAAASPGSSQYPLSSPSTPLCGQAERREGGARGEAHQGFGRLSGGSGDEGRGAAPIFNPQNFNLQWEQVLCFPAASRLRILFSQRLPLECVSSRLSLFSRGSGRHPSTPASSLEARFHGTQAQRFGASRPSEHPDCDSPPGAEFAGPGEPSARGSRGDLSSRGDAPILAVATPGGQDRGARETSCQS